MSRTPNIDLREDYGLNYIINGNFDFWQRGTVFNTTDNGYLADRFFYGSDNIQLNIEQSTDVPAGTTATYSYKVDRTTAAGAPTATQVSYIRYVMEGNDYSQVHSRKVTISFWVKTTAGNYTLNLTNGPFDRRYNTRYTVNQSNVWEKKTVTVALDDQGTWNFDETAGLQVFWVLGAGSSYLTSTEDAWENSSASADWALSDQTQFAENSAQSFQLAQVQMTLGAEDLPFRKAGRTMSRELQLCQRYYTKTYDIDVTPGTATSDARESMTAFMGNATTINETTRKFAQQMRSFPTLVLYNAAGTANVVSYITESSSNSVHVPFSIGRISKKAFNLVVSAVAGGGARGRAAQLLYYYTADADY